MKEIIEVIDSRIKSPLYGYFAISFLVLNWQVLFFLMFDKGDAASRISYFQDNTTILCLLIYPILIAVVYSLVYPWINYIFMRLCTKPTELRNALQAQAEHKLIIKKQGLEDARSKLLLSTETELIERAKRDEQLDQISDEDVKEKLKSELNQLRKERDNLRNNSDHVNSYEDYNKIMSLADSLRERAKVAYQSQEYEQQEKYEKQASELENKAHMLITQIASPAA